VKRPRQTTLRHLLLELWFGGAWLPREWDSDIPRRAMTAHEIEEFESKLSRRRQRGELTEEEFTTLIQALRRHGT
jgi:hypothetical protein